MIIFKKHYMAAVLLAGCNLTAGAATINITASFSPSMDNPENNTFTNTTTQIGYCNNWPHLCPAGQFSISLGGISLNGNGILYSSDNNPKNNFYLGLPVNSVVDVINLQTGIKSSLIFNITHFSGSWRRLTGGAQSGWNNGTFSYPSTGSTCSSGGAGIGSGGGDGNSWYGWAWIVSGGSCYKINTRESRDISSSLLNDISIGYKLTTPNPLLLESGTYVGYLKWNVGPDGDIDFGNAWSPSDTQLTINFTLSVNHELKLTTIADDRTVSLQPCASGRVCTEDEASANWERWMVTRITPQLTGHSNFRLSSSGAFSVYLECEQQSGPDCALRSDKMPSQTVPVRTLLTLPDNIVDNFTGSTVSKRELVAGKDLTKNIFTTRSFGQNRAGSIDFLVSQKNVDTMLTTRPDTYRGAVTVIFDPLIY